LPGCFAGNRPFPRETEGLPVAFQIDVNSEAVVSKKWLYETGNWLSKYLRQKADPTRSGQPDFYEVDLTHAEPIDVPKPVRYTDEVRARFDEKYKPAIGAQYFNEDSTGTSVVTEHRKYSIKDFVDALVRVGDVGMADDNEVVLIEWRSWSGSSGITAYVLAWTSTRP